MRKMALVTVLFLSLLGTTGCNGAKTKNQTALLEETAPQVQALPVTRAEIMATSTFTANVQANIVNNIAPTMAVRINQIYVEVGDFVKKGQKLVQMDNNNLQQAKTQLDNMELTFKRLDELYKVGGVSRSDWDAQKTALEVSRTSYQNLVDNTQLLSPIDGVITARNYDSGDLYTMGRPLLVVEQISPVKLTVNVSEQYFTKVKKGMPVTVTTDVYPSETFEGKVSLVYPTITATTRTFPVEIALANTQRLVRPGMFARVTMDLGLEDCVLIPDQAVIKQQGSGDRYAYVYNKEGKAEHRLLTLGRRLDSQYVVLDGVEEGELVITTGHNRITNGTSVEIVK